MSLTDAEVIGAALAPVTERHEEHAVVAAAICRHLRHSGHVPGSDGHDCYGAAKVALAALAALEVAQASPAGLEDIARWLAEQSGHPRYGASGYGWQGLIGSEANIQHAHKCAMQAVGIGARLAGSEVAVALDEAREVLLRHARSGATSPTVS